ncbi:ABC transporter substrate-binding protein [Butyrivibrio sp. INlla21]|uniref:ABC transporter substrate-binding protein n=1 Tax=Butyrivibrio sp. INlla21 TaxID=1520811 RepID=UPI0008E67636|nr:ABC transporter substrate-binding protein [Butyrivibrio sp. INlla21]SFU93924.1 raffinose/stachyose/melibiose transport system substrate-binding protein [Butyrivibrio sp. INlla21]
MKKKLLSMVMGMSMIMTALAGCGVKSADSFAPSDDATPAQDAQAAPSEAAAPSESLENVEISFYTTETGKDQMFQDIIAEFERINPNIKVEYIAAGDDQLQQWMALYASNEGPTVSLMDPINIWENQERMLELTNEPVVANIEENALSTMTFDGKIYAVPQTAAGVGILYNKEVCDKAVGGDFDPSTIKTRSDLEDLFKKIEATGVDATCFTGVNWSLGSHWLCQAYGGAIGSTQDRVDYVNSIIAGETKEIDNEVFNGYMDTFDMMAKYNHNAADPLVGDVNIDAQALAAGECGTWFMGDWAWTFLGPIVSEGQEFGLLPVPHSDDPSDVLNQSIATSYAKGYCIDKSQNTEAQQAAGLKFIEFITSDTYALEQMVKVTGQALPYKNCQAEIESPLGLATANYIAQGLTYDFYGTPNLAPSDIWYECGAYMCEYLAGQSDRATLAAKLDEYWSHQEKR